MNRLIRSGAVLAATVGLVTASSGAAFAHYCYKIDKSANKGTNGQAWLSKAEALDELYAFNEMAGGQCDAELADIEAFLDTQPDTWRLMLSGLLAGGTEGTDRTPEHFGYSIDVIGPFFGCVFGGAPE